jgi:hypothetical protein
LLAAVSEIQVLRLVPRRPGERQPAQGVVGEARRVALRGVGQVRVPVPLHVPVVVAPCRRESATRRGCAVEIVHQAGIGIRRSRRAQLDAVRLQAMF